MLNQRCFCGLLQMLLIAVISFGFFGCAKQPAKTAQVGEKQEAAQSSEKVQPSSATQADAGKTQEAQSALAEKKAGAAAGRTAISQYKVKRGDSLWWIARFKDVYNDPFLWPVIYEANKKKIKNPNLIYPGQNFEIPRKGYTLEKIKMIRKRAGAAKPYLPQQAANLPVD